MFIVCFSLVWGFGSVVVWVMLFVLLGRRWGCGFCGVVFCSAESFRFCFLSGILLLVVVVGMCGLCGL